MSKFIPGNHKHLITPDRLYIERQLNDGSSFKDIARFLCKDPSTISKEVRSHRLFDFYPGRGLFLNAKNFCIHRFHCQKKNVCNGCDKGHARCTIPHKYYYDALFADRRYRETLFSAMNPGMVGELGLSLERLLQGTFLDAFSDIGTWIKEHWKHQQT